MYPVLMLIALSATLAGVQTERRKLRIAAGAVLVLIGIITVWFTVSQFFH